MINRLALSHEGSEETAQTLVRLVRQAQRAQPGRAAAIEGEIRDAQTDELLAAGADRRRREGALPIDNWGAIDHALGFWAERLCRRLKTRTGGERTS